MEVTMIRHTSVAVPKGICYGQTDVALAPTFEEEAADVKNHLHGCRFDASYCSPLSRCRRLADYCGYSDSVLDSRLLEMNFGEWEMLRFDEIVDPRLENWYADYINTRVPGGESFRDQQERVKSFLSEMATSGLDKIVVFTHGGVIMQTMLLTGMATIENVFAKQPAYGAVMRFNLS
ncbi:MAG: alpha-ribazole phosphatase [Bacteroides sp.]|nr:alpha-ribazole phosphatase [Bacteroides sp.]